MNNVAGSIASGHPTNAAVTVTFVDPLHGSGERSPYTDAAELEEYMYEELSKCRPPEVIESLKKPFRFVDV